MVTSVLLTVIAFGAIIFIHELGHFLAALRVGIRVEKFYLGFDFWGMKLFHFKYRGTEYGVGVFPLGGYVKMAGQEDFGKAKVDGREDEFTSKTVWQRIQVLSAGVVFNFLSAFLLGFLALYSGYRLMAPVAGDVVVGSAAWRAGLQPGDTVIKYNGIPVPSFEALATEVALAGVDGPFPVVVQRGEEVMTLHVRPDTNQLEVASLGVTPPRDLSIQAVVKDSPADQAGFKPGDEVLRVDGKTLEKWSDLRESVGSALKENRRLELVMNRDGEERVLEVSPVPHPMGRIGIQPRVGREVVELSPDSSLRGKLFPGDRFVEVGGLPVSDVIDLKLDEVKPGFTIKAEGMDGAREVEYLGDWRQLRREVFFGSSLKKGPVVLSKVFDDSPAQRMKLKEGDRVEAFRIDEGEWVKNPNWSIFQSSISSSAKKRLEVKVDRGGEILVLSGEIEENTEEAMLGVIQGFEVVKEDILSTTLWWPFHMLRQTYNSLGSLITGKVAAKNLSGPIGILSVTYEVATLGIPYLLYLMALLSINIAFLNILPIPLLDGGHIFFCLIEWIKGSPVSEEVMMRFQYVGIALLLGMFSFATWNDLMRLL